MKSIPIVSMRLGERKTMWYESIADAAKAIGVNKKTLMRALKSPSGLVSETDPPVYVDYATAIYDVEIDENKCFMECDDGEY